MARVADAYVGIRLPQWLKDELREDAKRSGWKLSSQIVFELLERRGKWKPPTPYLPSPTHEDHRRRRKSAA